MAAAVGWMARREEEEDREREREVGVFGEPRGCAFGR
jgi:hypothetical protein